MQRSRDSALLSYQKLIADAAEERSMFAAERMLARKDRDAAEQARREVLEAKRRAEENIAYCMDMQQLSQTG